MTVADRISRELLAAERERTPVPPPTEREGALSLEQAYAIQRAGLRARLEAGASVVGHKVGLTSAAMQEMLGVDQPDFGYLTEEMVSPGGCLLAAHHFIAPRVELEIAFRLGERLGGAATTVEDVLARTDAVAPAIEVIDSRVADWRITIADTIADNASCGHVVIGRWEPLADRDLPALSGRLSVDTPGEPPMEVSGLGEAVLGHPAAAVAWLARALHQYAGEELKPGQVILPGAMARAVAVASGSVARGSISDLGTVEVRFA